MGFGGIFGNVAFDSYVTEAKNVIPNETLVLSNPLSASDNSASPHWRGPGGRQTLGQQIHNTNVRAYYVVLCSSQRNRALNCDIRWEFGEYCGSPISVFNKI